MHVCQFMNNNQTYFSVSQNKVPTLLAIKLDYLYKGKNSVPSSTVVIAWDIVFYFRETIKVIVHGDYNIVW